MTVLNDLEVLNDIEKKRILITGTFTKFCSVATLLNEKVSSGSWAEAGRHILISGGTCQIDTVEIEYAPEAKVTK